MVIELNKDTSGSHFWESFHQNGDPTFRKTSTGEVERCRSQDALKYVHTSLPSKSPAQVKAEARGRVLAECGDPQNNRLVLSRFTIQFGQYSGQTFQWLLENDIDYVAFLVAGKNQDHKMFPDYDVANKVRHYTADILLYTELFTHISVYI